MADMTAKMMTNNLADPVTVDPFELVMISPQQWDQKAHLFDNICQEQMNVFAAERWPQMNIDCLHFKLGDQLVAGCLMMHRSAPLGLGGLAVCKWGPVILDAAAENAELIHDQVIEMLVQKYAVSSRMMLSILPRPRPAESNFAAEQLLARNFKPGSGLPYPNRYFVNVHVDDDEMRASFGQKWRSHLKKSEKNGLEFEHCDMSRLPVFYELYRAMTDRKQFPDYSAFDSLHHLMDNIEDSARPELFLVHHEGEPVAGGIIFTAGDTAVYLYGATNDQALPLRAGYFMHWEIMRWLARQDRIKWYDLGGTDGFLGLHQFKNGMVGKAGVVSTVPKVMNYAHWMLPRLLGNGLFLVRDVKAQVMRWIKSRKSAGPNA
ncbi:lipid II:glycine glycyltransferase FemX [Maritalea sp.]|jgi:hypothetical protein|uniref:lipid II:glycine glycyltransferase FemX n=1 Tax=Maritalea sp. TaxID=2003361 RepID=UPI0039E5BEC1